MPPLLTRLVLPPRLPTKASEVITGAVGARGSPSAVIVALDGGSKNSGKLGRSNVTPPWMLVSWPGLPAPVATAS